MATRTSVATEDFQGLSVGTISGGNWLALNQWSAGVKVYDTAGAKRFASDNPSSAQIRWAGSGTFTDDQYAKCTLTNVGDGTNAFIGVIARASADVYAGSGDSRDYYFADVNGAGGTRTIRLGKVVAGTQTIITQATAVTWANGDELWLECEGTTLRVYHNTTLIYTETDSSLTTGKPGCVTYSPSGFTGFQGDDWEGGNLTSGVALDGAATGGASASAALVGEANLAGAATGGATASGALDVTPARSFEFTLYAVDGSTPLASKTGLWWAWWPSIAAMRTDAASAAGTGAATDASGVFSVVAPSALTPGDNQGFGIISDQDATPDATEAAYVGSFDVV